MAGDLAFQVREYVAKKFGKKFVVELTKEAVANRFDPNKMEWSDIGVSTVASAVHFKGAASLLKDAGVEVLNATNDYTLKNGYQNTFIKGHQKTLKSTTVDLIFSGVKGYSNNPIYQMNVDQVKYQLTN